jgi:hypothetical protein
MGHIKEPEGVDFIIKSKPLTDKERAEISEFISQYKAKHSHTKALKKRRKTSSKKITV